jgi:hypothetical protein
MGWPMILQISDEALSLIAEFVIDGFYDEAWSLWKQRRTRLKLHGPIEALFGDEPIMHTSRLTPSSMLQLDWRLIIYGTLEVDENGAPRNAEWYYILITNLCEQIRGRLNHDYGGFLLPFSRITREGCTLQDKIREELKLIKDDLIIFPYLHLHELLSVQANCELYTAMHEI